MRADDYGRPAWLRRLADLARSLRAAVPGGGYQLADAQVIPPFFIVGAGRSGNTLLRRMITAHPALHIPPETYLFPRCIRLFRRHRFQPWADLVNLVMAQFAFHPQFETFDMRLAPLVERLLKLEPSQRTLSRMLDALMREHASQAGGCRRWGDKTPLYAFHLVELTRLFPRLQCVWMVRDGVDVAVSYVNSGIYKSIAEGAHRWVAANEAIGNYTAQHGDRCLQVRYEALVRQPEAVLGQVLRFLQVAEAPGLAHDTSMVAGMGDVARLAHHAQVGQAVNQDSIGKGRRALQAVGGRQQRLASTLNPMLDRLGYQPL